MEIKKVVVVGAGLMGSGIAYVCASAGFTVAINDIKQEFVDKGINRIRDDVMTGIDKGKIPLKEAEAMFNRISGEVNLEEAVKDADLVIEAIFEKMEIKKEIFKKLDELAPSHTILASNTSTLSITEIGSVTNRPDKIIGMHFFSPVAAMKLLEIIKTENTSDETLQAVKAVADKLGKTAVVCKDGPGFIVNRILVPMLGEIIKLYEENLAPMDYLDKLFVSKGGFPMGPFQLADFVGLDIALHAAEGIQAVLGDLYKPADVLVNLVKEGKLGVKSGSGFTDLPKKDITPVKPDEYFINRVHAVTINEAAKLMEKGIAVSESDVDTAMKMGTNVSEGPFELAKKIGKDKVVETLNELEKEYGEFYKPSDYLKS
ncbi:MAG: 3-hydroxyacyl-CoA dehydrogenase NAD-binding domain-containing protein [Candidatus Hodarchaeales archaeon]